MDIKVSQEDRGGGGRFHGGRYVSDGSELTIFSIALVLHSSTARAEGGMWAVHAVDEEGAGPTLVGDPPCGGADMQPPKVGLSLDIKGEFPFDE